MINNGKFAQYVAVYLILKSMGTLTPLHINKLTYFSHGWMLGIYSKLLIHETVEAWKYGPVIPSIYNAFKKHGHKEITLEDHFGLNEKDIVQWENVICAYFSPEEKKIMDEVFKSYGDFTGSELINSTHDPHGPWAKYYDKNKFYVNIPNSKIKTYFKQLYETYCNERRT